MHKVNLIEVDGLMMFDDRDGPCRYRIEYWHVNGSGVDYARTTETLPDELSRLAQAHGKALSYRIETPETYELRRRDWVGFIQESAKLVKLEQKLVKVVEVLIDEKAS